MGASKSRRDAPQADLGRLEKQLGYSFADRSLLERALTHRSRSGNHNNERMEFLGDAFLGFVVGDELYRRHPGAQESELTLLRASLVRRRTLAEVARRFELGDYLRLGPGELKSGGFRRDSILSDVVEAVIGAVLLDAGEIQARVAVLTLLGERLESAHPDAIAKDAKTRLQEFLQGRRRGLPEYEVVAVGGTDHAREFRVLCRLSDAEVQQAEGTGASRRAAEQQAAAVMLDLLEETPS